MRFPALLLAAVVATTVAALPLAAQVPYQPRGDGFRVEFPGQPTAADAERASTRYGAASTATAFYTSPTGIVFYATHTVYPSGTAASEPQKVLDTVRIGRTAAGTLRSQQRFNLEGNPAQRDVVDWHGPRRVVIVALDVMRRDWLYSIYCFAPPGQENDPAIERFLTSFTLMPQ
jgi:hypothetical protein